MMGKVFKIFRKEGGLLRALGLWEWYKALHPKEQKVVKYYFSLKCIKSLKFPYKPKDLESGEVFTLYTDKTFLGMLAQTALLENALGDAEWLYLEALKMGGKALETHMILNDLVILAQKQKSYDKMERYSKADVELFPEYEEKLRELNNGILPPLNSFYIYLYILERKWEIKKAWDLLSYMEERGIPFYDETKRRIEKKLFST
ncbi:MAG: hypothetical protein ACK4SM_03890 [Aquificaceae bacterium]